MIKQQGRLRSDLETAAKRLQERGKAAASLLKTAQGGATILVNGSRIQMGGNLTVKKNITLTIHKYSAERLDTTVSMLAKVFVTNPLHISTFGPQRIDQNRLFFRIGLRHMFTGQAFVALVDDQVRGYIHFNPSPNCLPAPEEIPLVATTLLKPLGEAIPQVIKWFARWCHLDPEEPHVHLGPIGVTPEAQGQGIGTALMNRYIEHLKQEQSAGYLETDKPENVEFYKKFGFAVRRQEQLIGTTVWYMWRPRDNAT